MADYTEHDIEDIIVQMGQQIQNDAALNVLTREVNQYLREEIDTDDEDIMNNSMFASLSIDPAAQFLRRETVAPDAIQSPIISRRRRGKFQQYENLDYPEDFGDESESPEHYRKEHNLISQAYQTMGRVYNTCRGVSELVESLSIDDDVDFKSLKSPEGPEEDVTDEEGLSDSISIPASTVTKSAKEIIVDPSVRPVLSPKPGRAPFRFDPVTRYHLYKEEWDRHPAPGEKRRLDLRWKVREYMLRHDVPRWSEPMRADGRAEHNKDWSPKPYMD